MSEQKKRFKVVGESNLRFLRKEVERAGIRSRVSILQELMPVVYEDGTKGQEFIDVRSYTETAVGHG